jgi:glycosyltransferase involved in cell wall biosynthesis
VNEISIVLNIHKESTFLKRTLQSISDASAEAMRHGLKVQLVAVLDSADEASVETIQREKFFGFSDVLILHVEHLSLGLARNTGIQSANGEFIFTADADDLISKNSIIEIYNFAVHEKNVSSSAYFMEYLVAFGEKYYVAKFASSKELNKSDFIAHNTFTSRIFAKRELLIQFPYSEIAIESGFGFEDWDLNNRLFASGISMEVVKNTVLFYRIRRGSLLNQYSELEGRIVSRSAVHNFNFQITQSGHKQPIEKYNRKSELPLSLELLQNIQTREIILEAIKKDTTILIDSIAASVDYSPVIHFENHWSRCYSSLMKIIGQNEFTDIVLFQTLNPGGAEKYILEILDSIGQKDSKNSKFLILTLEESKPNSWRNNLGDAFTYIDLRNLFPVLNDSEIEQLLINSILTLASADARLHLKTSIFNQQFFLKYRKVLSEKLKVVYYRFSDSFYDIGGEKFRDGHVISFLQEALPFLYKIISDNKTICEIDQEIFGEYYSSMYHVINTIVRSQDLNNWEKHPPRFKLLWASRISSEKRPDLLALIINELKTSNEAFEIDIYGTGENAEIVELISSKTGLRYVSEFSKFSEIPIDEYDMLIYTSSFDGASIILLEALGSGIPVVAPNLGGIPETILNNENLVLNLQNEKQLAKEYANVIEKLYNKWNEVSDYSKIEQKRILDKHSQVRHHQEVTRVFELSAKEVGVVHNE